MTLFSVADICTSGMHAERVRMEVVANNIANAYTTKGPDGGPYRRKEVVFAAALDEASKHYAGVRVLGIVEDRSPFPRIYDPAHPDADASGFVRMPNVSVPIEMVDLMTAVRSYEANLKTLKLFREMMERTLQLLRTS